MKQSYKQITRKRRTSACRCLLVGKKIIFLLNFQQNRKNPLNKIPEMFVNCKQSNVFSLQKSYFFHFYPTDLVNTKTTIPLMVGEQRLIYTSTGRVTVFTPPAIHLPFWG